MKQVVGQIDYENNVRINPYELDFNKFVVPFCDHCGANHNLKTTYIVMLEDGSLIQVGYSCLRSILGYEPCSSNCYSDEHYYHERLYGRSNSSSSSFNVRRFLYSINEYSKLYGPDSVARKGNDILTSISEDRRFLKHLKTTKEDYTEVDKVIEFYKSFDPSNSFEINVRDLCIAEEFNIKYVNIIKYAFKVYDDAINYVPENTSIKTEYTSTKVEKIESIGIKVNSGYRWETESKMYRLIDDKGNVFQYATSTNLEVKAGDSIKFRYSTYPYTTDRMIKNTKKYGIINMIRNVKII